MIYVQRVSVQVYDEDDGEVCNEATTFIVTENRIKEIEKNMNDYVTNDILFNCKLKVSFVSENYYKTIIIGLSKLKIDKAYINMLSKYIKYKKYDGEHFDDELNNCNKTLFTWKQIKESNDNLCILKGHVINYGKYKRFKNKDLTFKYAKLYYNANIKNSNNYNKFELEQKEYINNMLLAHFDQPLNKYINIVGLLKIIMTNKDYLILLNGNIITYLCVSFVAYNHNFRIHAFFQFFEVEKWQVSLVTI